MLFEVLPWTGGLVSEAAESPYPVGNWKGEAATDVRWVGATGQQKLTDFAWLLVQVGLDEALLINPDVDVQEVYWSRLKVVIKRELDGWVEVVAVQLDFKTQHFPSRNQIG